MISLTGRRGWWRCGEILPDRGAGGSPQTVWPDELNTRLGPGPLHARSNTRVPPRLFLSSPAGSGRSPTA